MSKLEYIKRIFTESIAVKKAALEDLSALIAQAGEVMANALYEGHKILSCGNGGSAADAEHFAGEMMNRFLLERAPLPAVALSSGTSVVTAIANDYNYTDVFAKQVEALGNKGDVLLAISTSGNSANVVKAIIAAHAKGLRVIALTGNDGGKMAQELNAEDVELRVKCRVTPRVQETHIVIIHCLCELIEAQLFGARK